MYVFEVYCGAITYLIFQSVFESFIFSSSLIEIREMLFFQVNILKMVVFVPIGMS